MAKKKKTTKKKSKSKSTTEVKARTKSQIFGDISEKTGLTRKEVSGVFEQMSTMIKKDLGRNGPGTFTVPGLMKIFRPQLAEKHPQVLARAEDQLRGLYGRLERELGEREYLCGAFSRADVAAALGEGPRLIVIFQDDASLAAITELLAEIDGQIVEGPSQEGAFAVELTAGADAEATRTRAIEALQAREDLVRFAGAGS